LIRFAGSPNDFGTSQTREALSDSAKRISETGIEKLMVNKNGHQRMEQPPNPL
jgi:hypothetical protein